MAPSLSAKVDVVNKAVKMLRQLGLDPVVYKSCYLINNIDPVLPEERAKDIMEAFCDESIKGIFCIRAGYGTLDVLDHLDYELIRKNPKVFVGFSDITGMHLALNKYSNLVTFHGPLATSNLRVKGANGTVLEPYTKKYMEDSLFVSEPLGKIDNPEGEAVYAYNGGKASGNIIGGNLSLLQQTIGTKYEIDTAGKILYMEDFGESVDNIQKMISVLRAAGKFDNCCGVIVGPWTKCGEEHPEDIRNEVITKAVIDAMGVVDKPILVNIRSGHSIPMLTFPIGVNVLIDAEKNKSFSLNRLQNKQNQSYDSKPRR